jgi:hypothetical protein
MKFYLCCGSWVVLVLGVWGPAAHAQTNNERVTMSVEFDFSKRSPINPAPFLNKPHTQAPPGVMKPEALGQKAWDDTEVKNWTVLFSDGTVRRMLQRWADDAGYQLLWEVPRDFPVEIEMTVQRTFRDALSLVAKSLANTDAPIQININPEVRFIRVVRSLNSQAK